MMANQAVERNIPQTPTETVMGTRAFHSETLTLDSQQYEFFSQLRQSFTRSGEKYINSGAWYNLFILYSRIFILLTVFYPRVQDSLELKLTEYHNRKSLKRIILTA